LGSGYAQQWNFAIQHQLTNNLVAEIAYAGSKITHVGIPDTNINQLTAAQLALGPALLQRVPNPFFGPVRVVLAEHLVFRPMGNNPQKPYPDLTEFYRRKEARRKAEAKRPVSEKMAAVMRLREFERSLADVRRDNKEKRAAKQIRIDIKTR
jgi:hypothetical protein